MAMWKAHASTDDLKVLMAKNYIIRFESGVIVIKHWRMHNTLRKDRYTPTNFQEELKMLGIKSNGSYTLDKSQIEWLPDGCQVVAVGKVSKGKESKGKESVVECSASATASCTEKAEFSTDDAEERELLRKYPDLDLSDKDAVEEVKQFENQQRKLICMNGTLGKGVVFITPEQQDELLDKLGLDGFNYYIEKLANFIIEKDAKVSNHYATILKWVREDAKV
jgi:Asp-tRNA(Asn)/Glu-tRNA(Gln) amidotransferase C subunit